MTTTERVIKRLEYFSGQKVNENSFIDDHCEDSLDYMEFVLDLEDEFNVEIPDRDLDKVKTVKEMAVYLESKNV